MVKLEYKWNGKEQLAQIEAAGWEAVARCTLLLWAECSKAVGVPNPPPYVNSSTPGNPPKLRTGWGQRNIAYELDRARLTGRVGVRASAVYMAMLDQGTSRAAARPWLLATAQRIYQQLQALAQSP